MATFNIKSVFVLCLGHVNHLIMAIDYLRIDIKQITRTPFPIIPGSNCMGTFRWIGREGRSKV